MTLPRDAFVLTTSAQTAAEAEAGGRRAVLRGRDWQDQRDLRDNFSRLSRRVPACEVTGPEWLGVQADRMCSIVATNNNTGARRARRWVEHLLRNIALLADHPPGLRANGLRGWPAFIVGAGPSLDKVVCDGRQWGLQKRGVVLRVNSASLAMPGHVTVCAESNDLRHKLAADSAIRCFALTCPPEVMAHGSGPLRPIWVGEAAWVMETLTGIPRVPTSGSGLTTAVMLAALWGCDPIVLIGADSAYPGGRVYAATTGLDDRIGDDGRYRWGKRSSEAHRPGNPLPEGEPLERVQAWGGEGEVLSTPTFRFLRNWMTAAADTIDARCINASVGGAHIPGWTDATLSTVTSGMGIRTTTDLADMVSLHAYPVERCRQAAYEAAEMLVDTWALPDVLELLEERRDEAPSRWPWLEARITRRHRRQVLAMRELARESVRGLAGEACR